MMKYLMIFVLVLALVLVISGCNSGNNQDIAEEKVVTQEKEETLPEEEKEESYTKEIRDAIEKALEKESGEAETSREEDSGVELADESDGGNPITEEGAGEEETNDSGTGQTEEDISGGNTGENQEEEDKSTFDNIQDEIEALIEDIKAGNVIPDDHEQG